MITCPSCHKPVSGRPRSCGYCGTSLVQEYFREREPENAMPESTAGGIAATVLGLFGALAVLGALAFQLTLLFRSEEALANLLVLIWWLRVGAMALLPAVFLAQQLALRGVRFSLGFDGVWLFVAACGLGLTVQGYLHKGAAAFYGQNAIAYLLALGCVLSLVSCIIGICSVKDTG